MDQTKFVLHSDYEYPSIYLEVYINNELVSNTEIDTYSQIKYLDNTMIDEYNNLLNSNFILKCNELKKCINDTKMFIDKIKNLEILQNKKRELDLALNERDANV